MEQIIEDDIIMTISVLLSIFGSLFIIVDILKKSHYLFHSNLEQQILFTMSAFSIFVSIWLGIGQYSLLDEYICHTQAAILQFFMLALPCLNVSQAIHFWLQLHFYASRRSLMDQTPGSYRFSWIFYIGPALIFPLIFTSIGISLNVFGDAGLWCWIPHHLSLYRYILFYIPLWICISCGILFTVLGVYTVFTIEKGLKSACTKKSYKHTHTAAKSLLYALAFVIIWIPGTIDRIYETFHGTSPIGLIVLHKFFTPLQGFLNFLAFMAVQRVKFRNGELSENSHGGAADIEAAIRVEETMMSVATLNYRVSHLSEAALTTPNLKD